MRVSDCEFCQIAQGVSPATVVFESPLTVAFFPLSPAVPGHTLLIPKTHVTDFLSLTDGHLVAELGRAAVHMGNSIRTALEPEGMNLITSAGAAATQTVFHLHLHLVPRWSDDRIGDIWPPSRPMSDGVKDDVADAVRQASASLPFPA